MNEIPSIVLSHSGYRAVIETDRWVPGSFTLVVDGTPQSHVNMDNPAELFFEYIQRMGHVIDQIGMPGQPITAVHLGAGAFTLPRYIEATRPGSRQQVVEIDSDLVDFVRAHLPWSPRALYLLTDHRDVRFTQDGIRDGEQFRPTMTQWFVDELKLHGERGQFVRGNREERLAECIALIDGVLAERADQL